MFQQIIVFSVIGLILFLFMDGRIRYEFVSMIGLLLLALTGIIRPEEAFAGFGHPAVITVASVLVISKALIKSGVIENIVSILNGKTESLLLKTMGLMVVTALLSAFMNNVGALALILPVAIRIAKDSEISPSQLLMPVAFSSLLGGMVTVIGTPPNLIVSNYREQATGVAFEFFDFAPIGLAILIVGVLFTVFLGIRLIPKRKSQDDSSIFNIGKYLSEIVITSTSKIVGKRIRDFYSEFKLEIEVLSIVRGDRKIIVPSANEILMEGDILLVKADGLELTDLVNRTEVALKGAKIDFIESIPFLKSREFSLVEVVLRDDSLLIGRTAMDVRLRNRYNVNLVAVSRRGTISFSRLKNFRFKAGDILLLQVPVGIIPDIYDKLSCLPLAERSIDIETKREKSKQYLPISLFILGIILTTLGLVPVQISFATVAILLAVTKQITPREFYEAIEWPTIILLGSLLPLGQALQTSGASTTIAKILMHVSNLVSPAWMVAILMVITIVITNLISSTATAVLMGPIALSLAEFIGVSPDPFLMGVCIASSSAFLTPIGHQSNMLVMGPGGYKFTDYWRVGLPLSILIITVATSLILLIWRF